MRSWIIIRPLLFIALLLPGMIMLRLGMDQIQGFKEATARLEKGDAKAAVMYFGRVLNAHIPLSPLEHKSLDHLIEMGENFEAKKELELSLLCYETARTSIYLTRSVFLSNSKNIEFLNSKIAAIKERMYWGENPLKDRMPIYEEQLKIMSRDYSPRPLPAVLALLFFFGYIAFTSSWGVSMNKNYLLIGLIMLICWIISLSVV